jgi:hypothetical protein
LATTQNDRSENSLIMQVQHEEPAPAPAQGEPHQRRQDQAAGQQEIQATDAFSRYSSDFLRMKTLLSKEDDDDFDVAALAATYRSIGSTLYSRQQHVEAPDPSNAEAGGGRAKRSIQEGPSSNSQDGTRKTRLSFEVHHSLVLMPEFLALYGEGNAGGGDEQAAAAPLLPPQRPRDHQQNNGGGGGAGGGDPLLLLQALLVPGETRSDMNNPQDG